MKEEKQENSADSFSNKSKEVISYSRIEALRLENDFIGPEHLILGILKHSDNTGSEILKYSISNLDRFKIELENATRSKTIEDDKGKFKDNLQPVTLPLTKLAEKIIRVSVLESKIHNNSIVDSGCLLLSILRSKDGYACQLLEKYGLDYEKASTLYFQIQNTEKEQIESTELETDQNKKQRQDETSQVQKLLERVIQVSMKDTIDGVLDIENESSEIAALLTSLSLDQGMMFGLFGQWGRGKTFFWKSIWKNLSLNSSAPFYKAEFHAWKYQDTPASWAYLYEILADSYFNSREYKYHCFKKLAYWIKRIKLNIKRKGFNLFGSFLLSILFAVFWYFAIPLTFKFELLFRASMSLGIIVLLKLIYLYFIFKPKAMNVLTQYSENVSFQKQLGLQAEIQKEMSILLQTWIPKNKIGKKRVLLFIDDIDRCNEAKIIQLIDSLRIMLDETEIAKRCVILAAIDERILKIAISTKYYELVSKDFNEETQKKINLNNLVREYMDKLFVGGIKLRTLNQVERKEILESLTKGKIHIQENETKPIKEKSSSSIRNEEPNKLKNVPIGTSKNSSKGTEISKEENFELENFEYQYLQNILETCGSITPRIIRIFYYRYLLAKRFLFIKLSHDPDLYNKWHNSGIDKSILPSLIMFFTVNVNPEEINSSYLLWSNSSSSTKGANEIHFTLLGRNFIIDNNTLKELLQIIEIIVPY